MFKLLATALALVVTLAAIPSTSAFSHVTMRTKNLMARSSTTRLDYIPQESVDRALDCANNYGMCDIEELLDLSEELDEFLEGPPQAVEVSQNLAEALLVQGEMREHDQYVQDGNVFNLPNEGREDAGFLFGP